MQRPPVKRIKSSLRLASLFVIMSMPSAFALRPAPPQVNMSRLVFHDCRGECQAKASLKKLRPFKLASNKDGMKNPLAIEVCQAQLGGFLVFHPINGKERGVCAFKDNSKLELHGLHTESEKFVQP